jgi:hemerythrin
MNFIEITNNELTNVHEIDLQHNEIVNVVNTIHEALLFNNFSTVANQFKTLVELFENHFEYEETLMKRNNFQGYFTHKLEHDRFYKQLLESTCNYSNRTGEVGSEIVNRIKRWLFNHIELNDKKCGVFFNSIGIK